MSTSQTPNPEPAKPSAISKLGDAISLAKMLEQMPPMLIALCVICIAAYLYREDMLDRERRFESNLVGSVEKLNATIEKQGEIRVREAREVHQQFNQKMDRLDTINQQQLRELEKISDKLGKVKGVN